MEVCDYLNIPTAPEGEGWNQGPNTQKKKKKKEKKTTKKKKKKKKKIQQKILLNINCIINVYKIRINYFLIFIFISLFDWWTINKIFQ